ncbi:hypothetical protein KC19_3G217600 [Ceratodon purpureus]|uniref:DUF4283 domain-containing protein n=1 Tax=Ceratodon purpureus TaxID=3225 RepID=A0A8T0INI8_CERPU|nr:hypothetical protein KC19_3G217600 [Ceratodon purpureus]
MAVLQNEAAYLRDHTVIASFLGKRIPPNAIPDWITQLNQKLGFQAISFKMDMGRGFFFLATADSQITRQILSLTPHVTKWGTCIYQEWEPGFDPDEPAGLKILSWINLVRLPHEFKPLEGLIASSLGPVYTADPLNGNLRDPRFCVRIDARGGWPSAINLVGIGGKHSTILVNYAHIPARCRFCLSLSHKVADCVSLKLNGASGPSPQVAQPRGNTSHPAGNGLQPNRKNQGAPPPTHTAYITPAKKPSGQIGPNRPSPPLGCSQAHYEGHRLDQAIGNKTDSEGFTRVTYSRKKNGRRTPASPSNPSPPRNRPRQRSPTGSSRKPPPSPPLLSQWIKHSLDPHPSSPALFTSQQVHQQLETPIGSDNESGDSMVWSPGRFGRNPGTKRLANAASPNRKRLQASPQQALSGSSSSLQPDVVRQSDSIPVRPVPKDSPTKIRVILDKPPAEAFRLLEEEGFLNNPSSPDWSGPSRTNAARPASSESQRHLVHPTLLRRARPAPGINLRW